MAMLSVVLEGLHTHSPNHNSRSGTPVPPHRGPLGGPPPALHALALLLSGLEPGPLRLAPTGGLRGSHPQAPPYPNQLWPQFPLLSEMGTDVCITQKCELHALGTWLRD